MASFEYIESAIILNLDNKTKLRTFRHTAKDFAAHGQAYTWVIEHFDKYGQFATPESIVKNFPNLDIKANSVNFDYAVEEFKNHLLQRTVRNAVNKQVNMIAENPKKLLVT